MSLCLIGLGANLGDRAAALQQALAALDAHPAIKVRNSSGWHETLPAGGPPQPPYLNAAAVLETALSPHELLEALQAIERQLGRGDDGERWGPRTIDLDLLLYEQLVISSPGLVLPHPRMAWRRFVLQPAAEMAAEWLHPTTGWTIARLLAHLDHTPRYVAISGAIGVGKTRLAEEVARASGARLLAEPVDLDQLDRFYRDPASQAWTTELKFLRMREELLAGDAEIWARSRRWTISDFWFDQSLAFARVWLGAEDWARFREQWEQAKQRVVRPRLLVLLDAPDAVLTERIRRRGRRCEQALPSAQLARIRQAIAEQAAGKEQGPIMRLFGGDLAAASQEVLAAIAAM
jgi:2-amino-4-hydroxy-6-hydroxymethyldihydropteridine diphosphokinase